MCEGLWQTLAVAGEEHFKVTKPEKQVTDRDRKQFTMKPKTPNTESWNETSQVDMSPNVERCVFNIKINEEYTNQRPTSLSGGEGANV